jgi:hypothetical protein
VDDDIFDEDPANRGVVLDRSNFLNHVRSGFPPTELRSIPLKVRMEVTRLEIAHLPLARSRYVFEIVDAGGEVFFPRGETLRAATESARQAEETRLIQIIKRAAGIVMCVPMGHQVQDTNVKEKQVEFVRRLAEPDIMVKRFVLCLTKYETAWLREGRNAIHLALNKERFADAAHVALEDRLVSALVALEKSKRLDVRVAPVSVYGFVKENGCANYDHGDGSGEGKMLLGQTPDQHLQFEQRWQPFLVGDPFVFVASGLDGALTLRPTEIARLRKREQSRWP